MKEAPFVHLEALCRGHGHFYLQSHEGRSAGKLKAQGYINFKSSNYEECS